MRAFTAFESHVSFANVVTLVQAVAWPLVIVTLIFIYRREIPKLIQAIGGRISKLSAVGVTLELAAASPLSETLRVRLEDIREPSKSGPTPLSGMQSLIDLARSSSGTDYVRIDLREGESWLTSRLYLFAVVLPPVLGVRCFVFVNTVGHVPRHFLGLSSPEAVKRGLEAHYTWLRSAMIDAQVSPLGGQPPNRYMSWYPNDRAALAMQKLTCDALRVPVDSEHTEALRKLTRTPVRNSLNLDQVEALRKLTGLSAQTPLNPEQAKALQTLTGLSAPASLNPEEAEALRKLTAAPPKLPLKDEQIQALKRMAGLSLESPLNVEQAIALKNLLAAFASATLNTEQAEALESLTSELVRAVDWSQTGQVEDFVNRFLQCPRLKRLHKVPSPSEPPDPDQENWVRLGDVDERAQWIRNERQLLDLLGDGLRRECVVVDGTTFAAGSSDSQTKAVLAKQGDFVAVIDSEGRFKRLIDREALLERFATAGQ